MRKILNQFFDSKFFEPTSVPYLIHPLNYEIDESDLSFVLCHLKQWCCICRSWVKDGIVVKAKATARDKRDFFYIYIKKRLVMALHYTPIYKKNGFILRKDEVEKPILFLLSCTSLSCSIVN
jgi:hypothetical protein